MIVNLNLKVHSLLTIAKTAKYFLIDTCQLAHTFPDIFKMYICVSSNYNMVSCINLSKQK